jgi:ADP-ribosylglycohydrolase
MTHRDTGLYSAMFIAAAMAAMPFSASPLDAFATALRFVPAESRFAEAVRFGLDEVARAETWLAAYERINGRYGDFGHCKVLQEIGTLINTLHFARDVGDGICIQVMQGNDTDSFGATAGSLAGLFFGPGSLGDRWITPFGDDLRAALALFHERSLGAVAERMGRLPAILRGDLDPPTTLLPY